jgi:hypothetical protein
VGEQDTAGTPFRGWPILGQPLLFLPSCLACGFEGSLGAWEYPRRPLLPPSRRADELGAAPQRLTFLLAECRWGWDSPRRSCLQELRGAWRGLVAPAGGRGSRVGGAVVWLGRGTCPGHLGVSRAAAAGGWMPLGRDGPRVWGVIGAGAPGAVIIALARRGGGGRAWGRGRAHRVKD